jgi:hypothetical protein
VEQEKEPAAAEAAVEAHAEEATKIKETKAVAEEGKKMSLHQL